MPRYLCVHQWEALSEWRHMFHRRHGGVCLLLSWGLSGQELWAEDGPMWENQVRIGTLTLGCPSPRRPSWAHRCSLFTRRSPCKNGGLCEDDRGFAAQLACRCLAGFSGTRCEVDVDDCILQPCANGATCLDGINRFSCLCPPGYTGRFCTVNVDDCASRPCANGGRCLDRVATFHCHCLPGFAGKTCEMPLRNLNAEANTPSWTSRGWAGTEGGVTPPRPHLTAASNTTNWATADSGERLLKISVKEVVTQRGVALTEVQLITLLVLGGMTVAVVGMTAVLVLRGHWRDRSARYSPPPGRFMPAERECNISFLHSPTLRLEKKQLNTDVI